MKSKFTVSLSPDTLRWLTTESARMGLSRSALIEIIVRAAMHGIPAVDCLRDATSTEYTGPERRKNPRPGPHQRRKDD
jgi:hypothetical protein